jgi:hypothetical protein
VEVKDEVQFAYITKMLVEYLYELLNQLQKDELIIILINDGDEVQ